MIIRRTYECVMKWEAGDSEGSFEHEHYIRKEARWPSRYQNELIELQQNES